MNLQFGNCPPSLRSMHSVSNEAARPLLRCIVCRSGEGRGIVLMILLVLHMHVSACNEQSLLKDNYLLNIHMYHVVL